MFLPRRMGRRSGSILHPEDGSETPEARSPGPKCSVSEKYTLTDNLWGYLQDYAEKHRARETGSASVCSVPTIWPVPFQRVTTRTARKF